MAKRWPGFKFTLIEMLVVIAIISVLMTILLPALKKARNVALSGACLSNQRQCGLALASYAADYDDWLIGAECSNKTPYNMLSEMMMATDYAPRVGIYIPGWGGGMSKVPTGQVYMCLGLQPPGQYKMWATNFPTQGYPVTSMFSFGLRGTTENNYYAGEKIAPGPLKGLVKYSSVYQPSRLPYMVDSVNYAYDLAGTGNGGPIQWSNWYMGGGTWAPFGFGGALHMRHNRKANVWFPDGHATGWKASDTSEFSCPWQGAENPSWPIGFTY